MVVVKGKRGVEACVVWCVMERERRGCDVEVEMCVCVCVRSKEMSGAVSTPRTMMNCGGCHTARSLYMYMHGCMKGDEEMG